MLNLNRDSIIIEGYNFTGTPFKKGESVSISTWFNGKPVFVLADLSNIPVGLCYRNYKSGLSKNINQTNISNVIVVLKGFFEHDITSYSIGEKLYQSSIPGVFDNNIGNYPIGYIAEKKKDTDILYISLDISLPISSTGSIIYNWMDLARGYKTTPTLLTTIVDGDVYEYVYNGTSGDVTYYRLVPSGAADDAFYETFSGGILSNLIDTKEITI